ncbi:YbaB/EbfC family nucleoid-associated protein [Amycolatopsis acidicola]|nr:YbaB/EbfC family nucleoid-associated protein [Amycolatopsis acidicola]
MTTDPARISREIAERALLHGKDEPGAEGESDNRQVSVSLAKNGDLTGLTIDPAAAPGVDTAKLAADVLQAWRQAQRTLFRAVQDEMWQTTGVIAPESFYQAIEERFRDPAPAPAEDSPPGRQPKPPPRQDDEYFDQVRWRET